MKAHELKTDPELMYDIRSGRKPFEVRKNDRDFKVGDILILKAYDRKKAKYTDCYGPDIPVVVQYILHGKQYGVKRGYCIMGITLIKDSIDYRDGFSYLSNSIRHLNMAVDKLLNGLKEAAE